MRFLMERCQELCVPLTLVSDYLLHACRFQAGVFRALAEVGGPVRGMLSDARRSILEALYGRIVRRSAGDSLEEPALPSYCTEEWFTTTFCAGSPRRGDCDSEGEWHRVAGPVGPQLEALAAI